MSALPGFDEVAATRAWLEGVVSPDQLDVNDHVNITHYLHWASLAVVRRCEALGLGTGNLHRTGTNQFSAEYHLRFLHELRVGDRYSVHVRTVDRRAKTMQTVALVLDRTRTRLCFLAELVAVNVDMATRRPVPFTDDLAAAVDAAIAHDEGLPWPAPRSGALALRG